MSDVTIDRFDEYFRELHGHGPYSWQQRLAERAVAGDWPRAIDLPTGTGKTACIDIAVFALASQAGRPAVERTVPRRIFFCVNRRVVVDEAHQRATRIARQVWDAEQGATQRRPVLRDVAAALRVLAGTKPQDDAPPLDVVELRGGIYRDNRWARSATQPTIVCTTVDQLGSRLLFRGYGVSPNAAPIQAALIAYDSLILLDEAHISRPFLQTLAHVRRYLDPERWAEREIGVRGLHVIPMTATPPEGESRDDMIRIDAADRRDESLDDRLRVSKPAELREVQEVTNATAEAATALAAAGPTAVGIIVNRVSTARAVYDMLRKAHPDVVIELVIGSMRPFDRDAQTERLETLVGPDRRAVSTHNSFVVATQCLEVGANYDFDALVTECASLDALRQRFGRLNRGGRDIRAAATILMPADATRPKQPDPIYGDALPATWNWLWKHPSRTVKETHGNKNIERRWVDFGIDAFESRLREHGDNGRTPAELLAPSAKLEAPVMLPAYVDFWCQTAPRPTPDPDVSLFLHGRQRGEPDVQVCWRADIGEGRDHPPPEQWIDVVALLAPTSAECMSVPISLLRRWLTDQPTVAPDEGDLLGVSQGETDEARRDRGWLPPKRRGVLWRGAEESIVIQSPDELWPGDTLVLPVSAGGWNVLGHLPFESETQIRADANGLIDCAEAAFLTARDRLAFRIHPALRARWPEGTSVDMLFNRLSDQDDPPPTAELCQLLQNAANALKSKDPERARLIRKLAAPSNLLREEYPDARGELLTSRQRVGRSVVTRLATLDDGDDEPSRTRRDRPVTLADHTQHVVDEVRRAVSLLSVPIADAFSVAAKLHDVGKADERFQAMLRRADRTDAWLLVEATSALLAKSDGLPLTRSERDAAGKRAGLPPGFRHEMLSALLADLSDQLPADATASDLALHLIAAHHGHARPFAPVVVDEDPPDLTVWNLTVASAERLASPQHRLDSGIARRFWSLTRRFGWWGLAYLESILRLADQQASAAEDAGRFDHEYAHETTDST